MTKDFAFTKLTPQQIFDKVALHLLGMKEQAEDALGACTYRSPFGTSCAAGCLLTDEEYDKKFEGSDWGSLVNDELVPGYCCALIRELQGVHDSKCHWSPEGLNENGRWELILIARDSGLKYSHLNILPE